MSGFAVGNVRNRTGVENADIRLVPAGNAISSVSKLPGQKLTLSLIELATESMEGYFGLNFHGLT